MKRVLIAVTSCEQQGKDGGFTGYELMGVSHAYLIFRDLGYEVDFVSPQGGNPPIEKYNLSDPISRAFLEDQDAQGRIHNSRRPEAIEIEDYIALFCAGGEGAMWDFPNNPALEWLIAEIYQAGGVIGAVGEGLASLINVKLANGQWLLKGKRIHSLSAPESDTSHSESFVLETSLQQRGAILRRTLSLSRQIVVSDRLITCQEPQATEAVARAMSEIIGRCKSANNSTSSKGKHSLRHAS